MKGYYIVEYNEQKGPFSLEELKKVKILPTTLVWKEGLSDWNQAKDIKELEILFKSAPPPLPKEKNITENKIIIGKKESKPKSIEDEIAIQKRKTVIAKEVKLAGKIALISIFIGFVSFFLFFYLNNGFEYINLKSKFESSQYQSEIEEYVNRSRSFRRDGGYYHPQGYELSKIGFTPPEGVDCTDLLISAYKGRVRGAITESIKSSLLTSFLVFLIIYLVRIGKKGINWVSENSSKKV